MSHQEKEIIARDYFAEKHEENQEKQKGYFQKWLETSIVLFYANIKRNDIVLDAGSGTGRITRIIAKKCKKVYAVDFSKKSLEVMAKRARSKNINNIIYIHTDLTSNIPINDEINKVVCVQVIQHIPGESERIKALKTIFNCLKTGGMIIVTVYNWNKKTENKGLRKQGFFEHGISYFRYTPDEIRSQLENCGFDKVTIRGYINFGCYGIFGNKIIGNLLLLPFAILDRIITKFEFSTRTGFYLVCTGLKSED